ncbi:MAG TPA: hypothetical protein VJ751_08070, partial [Pyrinomonadaceae bacterium]|nr:hypothetical protein [Pyrinomonadaceae bacterium]
MTAEIAYSQCLLARSHNVSHEARFPVVITRDHYALTHVPVLREHRFNFPELDPEATHFHLSINAAEILEVA